MDGYTKISADLSLPNVLSGFSHLVTPNTTKSIARPGLPWQLNR